MCMKTWRLGARLVVQYTKKAASPVKCGCCKKALAGVDGCLFAWGFRFPAFLEEIWRESVPASALSPVLMAVISATSASVTGTPYWHMCSDFVAFSVPSSLRSRRLWRRLLPRRLFRRRRTRRSPPRRPPRSLPRRPERSNRPVLNTITHSFPLCFTQHLDGPSGSMSYRYAKGFWTNTRPFNWCDVQLFLKYWFPRKATSEWN